MESLAILGQSEERIGLFGHGNPHHGRIGDVQEWL